MTERPPWMQAFFAIRRSEAECHQWHDGLLFECPVHPKYTLEFKRRPEGPLRMFRHLNCDHNARVREILQHFAERGLDEQWLQELNGGYWGRMDVAEPKPDPQSTIDYGTQRYGRNPNLERA